MTRNTSSDAIHSYLSDFTQYINLPFSFMCISTMFKQFSTKQTDVIFPTNSGNIINGVTVIDAELPVARKGNKYEITYNMELKHISDTSFLAKLLTLKFSLSKELFCCFNDLENLISIYDNKPSNNLFKKINYGRNFEPMKISEQDLNRIKLWCTKHGYPFYVRPKLKYTHFVKQDIDNTHKSVKYYSPNMLVQPNITERFWVWEFLLKLHILHLTYCLFCKVKNITTAPMSNTDDFINYTAKDCEQLLEKVYSKINIKCVPDFDNKFYKYKNNNFPMNFYANDIFDLAMYSLFLFMKSGQNHFAQCPICNKLFVRSRRNQIYCKTKPCDVDKCNPPENNPNCHENCNRLTCYPQLKHKRKKLAEAKKKKISN